MAWWHGNLQNFTGHVKLRESLFKTVWLQNHLVGYICAAKVKVYRLLRLLCIDLAYGDHTTFFQEQSQWISIAIVAHSQCGAHTSMENKRQKLAKYILQKKRLESRSPLWYTPGTVLPPKMVRQSRRTVRLTWNPTASSLIVYSWKMSAWGNKYTGQPNYWHLNLSETVLQHQPEWMHWLEGIWSPLQWLLTHSALHWRWHGPWKRSL